MKRHNLERVTRDLYQVIGTGMMQIGAACLTVSVFGLVAHSQLTVAFFSAGAILLLAGMAVTEL